MMTAEELAYYGQEGQQPTPQEAVAVQFSLAHDQLRSFLQGQQATKEQFEAVTTDFLTAFDEYYFGEHSTLRGVAMANPEKVIYDELEGVMSGIFDNATTVGKQYRRYLAGEPGRGPVNVSRACGFAILEQVQHYSAVELS